MQIVNYVLFMCFINFCNSFTFTLKSCPNFIARIYRHTLNMGCDYYIDKNLDIYDDNDTILSYINLEHERGYYWFSSLADEDENSYDTKLAQYIKDTLEPTMKPIVIYSNNTFHKVSFENKYKKIIENEIKICNKTFNDVSKVVKIERRYERC